MTQLDFLQHELAALIHAVVGAVFDSTPHRQIGPTSGKVYLRCPGGLNGWTAK